MADKKVVREKNPMSEAVTWNDRILTEIEAPHKWNEAWGSMFQSEVPHDYKERISYLEKELKSLPTVKPYPKYGGGDPLPTYGVDTANKRKKMFREPED